jgi:tetratricopeptide (TPR) repeat protein
MHTRYLISTLLLILSLDIYSQQQTKTVSAYFPIQLVAENSDIIEVTVPAGKNLGITAGQKGGVLTRWYSGEEYENRNNQIIGNITISDVYDTFSKGVFNYNVGIDTLQMVVWYNDMVYLSVEIPEETYDGLLLRLLSLNIHLMYPQNWEQRSATKTSFYNWNKISKIRTVEDEVEALKFMLDQIQKMGNQLNDSIMFPEYFQPNNDGGRFDKFSMIAILLQSNLLDLSMFLDFVSDYPYKYMGFDYFLDETFATWAINKTPLTSNAESVLQNHYRKYLFKPDFWGSNYYLNEIQNKKKWIDDFPLKDTLKDYNSLIKLWSFLKNDSIVNHIKLSKIVFLDTNYSEIFLITDEILRSNDRSADTSIYWYRAAAQYMLKDYQNAIVSFDSLDNLLTHSSVNAYRAWSNIFLGNWRDARADIRKAFDLDTTHPFWNALMGNMYLLMNKNDSAKYFYIKSLEKLSSQSQYNAIKDDFDVFIKRGWHEESSNYFKEFFANHYDTSGLKEKLKSSDFFNQMLAIDDYKNKLSLIDSAIHYEKAYKYTRFSELRNYYRWKAYSYFQVKNYLKSLKYYEEALDINKRYLLDATGLFSDYDDLAYLSKLVGDTVKQIKYTEFRDGAKHKKISSDQRNLFIFSCPSDYTNIHPEEKFINTLTSKENLAFKSKTFNCFSPNSTQLFEQQVDYLLANASKDDVFIFYFQGKTYSLPQKDEKGIIIGKDSVKSERLQVLFSFLPVQNVLLIFDGNEFKFVEDFISYIEGTTHQNWKMNLKIITNPKNRIYLESQNHTLLSWAVENLIDENQVLFTNDIERNVEKFLSSQGIFWTAKSYAFGYPFMVYNKVRKKVVNTTSIRTRGAAVEYTDDYDNDDQKDEPTGSYALVFGISEYDHWSNLKNPTNDARAVHRLLEEKYSFESRLLLNSTTLQIEAAIRSIKNINAERIVIFFAGHGFYEEETQNGYLVLNDSKLPENDFKKTSYYDYNRLIGFLQNLKCKNILVIIDACFSGTIENNSRNLGEGYCKPENRTGFNRDMYLGLSDSAFIARHNRCHNMKFITSGGKEYVPDGTQDHSPFAAKFIEILENSDGLITYSEIRSGLLRVDPQPRFGRFGTDAASSEFLLVSKLLKF